MKSFEELNLDDRILEGIGFMGFKKPTPVQAQAIPPILSGSDLIGCAQTGTGKTAAFVLPLLDKICKSQTQGVTKVLILVPTRELAKQIDAQIEALSYFVPVVSQPIYGGSDSSLWENQKKAITKGADILIATPGRILTHFGMGYAKMDGLEVFVLDEADKMLEMGFYEDIIRIMKFLPEKRQNLLFSATMPPKIRELAKKMLKNPEEVNISPSRVAKGVEQKAYLVHDNLKIRLLIDLMRGEEVDSVIIFASSKIKVDTISRTLKQQKIDIEVVHSDLDQSKREENLRKFKNRQIKFLVATDILSRGIDVEGISHVVNYDVPHDPEDYVHRIGRTARAEKTGHAITFISQNDFIKFNKIERFVQSEIQILKTPAEIGDSPDYEQFVKNSTQKRKHHGNRPFNKTKGGSGNRNRNNNRNRRNNN